MTGEEVVWESENGLYKYSSRCYFRVEYFTESVTPEYFTENGYMWWF